MTQGGQVLINWLALRHGEQERVWTAEALHQQYLADVFSYVARRISNRQEAEDITAEVFAAAFAAPARQRGQNEPYFWLLGIARRKIADALRRQGRREGRTQALTDDLPTAAADLPEAAMAREERARLLRGMLAVLPDDQREALLLHYVEGLAQTEVAAVLGRSPSAVNSLLQRARASVYRQGQDYFLGESEADK